MTTVTARPATAWYIQRLKTKLATGQYATETTACFCGSTRARQVTDQDRYGIPHAMHLCLTCGILYASPRMTEAAYADFYAQEYRAIYDDEDAETTDENFARSETQAKALQQLLAVHDRSVSTVFDVGCNSGAWLKPFQDAGCTVYGVDYGAARVAYGQAHGLPVVQGGIEQLEALGLQADLIILSHVLEHFLDLETTLKRIHHLLTPNGTLYVNVPGLFLTQKDRLFQNAHPWQFTAETLTYVMECCGFEEIMCDQQIVSLWGLSQDDPRPRTAVPSQHLKHIYGYVFLDQTPIPIIRTVNKFPTALRKRYIHAAMSRHLPDITELKGACAGQSAVIITGGPSVSSHLDTIRTLQANGAKVLAIERMYQWCLDRALIPDYVVCMDADDDVVESFQRTHALPIHLVATQCPPAVYDALAHRMVYLFSTPQRELRVAEYWEAGGYDAVTVINGGGSVSLCAMAIAMTLGMTRLHIFGFDCHVSQGNYADGITGVGAQDQHFQLRIGASDDPTHRIFETTTAYASFAQQFFQLMGLAEQTQLVESVTVYGDSMVNAMAAEGHLVHRTAEKPLAMTRMERSA